MYLKSLTLKGFKSFADKVRLQLEPGVTVVVGPNGSGKSNISDGVLWVLGEQSAKSLRGNSMEDVIFAGSSARQAVGVAEVDLVLDNSCGTLPLEFNEVTITRRMFRNGESEYLVNNSPCRLMDVHELLHDSGLGRDTHSIISQGRLDEILNSRPEDRRSLIEEAAGVLKHKKRKERAIRKLLAMDTHLDRIRDITSEIDRQLKPLQRQATKAQQHAGLTTELRELEIALAVDDLKRLQEQWNEVGKREREADAEIELMRYRLAEKERELSKFQSLLEEKGLFVGDLSEQRRRLQSILERLNSGLLLLEEKGKNLIERLSELRAKLHHSQTRLAQRTEEVGTLIAERGETDAQLKALYGQLSELRRDAEAVKKERLSSEEALQQVNAAIRRARKDSEDGRAELMKVEQTLAAFVLESDLLGDRAAAVKEQRTSVSATLSARRARLEGIEKQLQRTRKELALADSDVDKRVRVLDGRRRELEEKRSSFSEVRAESRGLTEVDRAFHEASPALAWSMSTGSRLEGVLGPLTDRITVPATLETLVERALGRDVFCILTSDRASAVATVDRLLADEVADVCVLPIEGARVIGAKTGFGERLSDRVGCADDIRPAVEALLGDVYVLPTLTAALEAASKDDTGARFGTPEGHLVHANGKVSLAGTLDDNAGVLARKRRINELTDEAEALTTAVGELEAQAGAAEEALIAAQQDALDLSQKLATLSGDAEAARAEVGRIETELTGLDDEAARIATRVKEIADRTGKDRPQQQVLADRITTADAEVERLEEESAGRREDRDNRFRDEAAIANRLSACQVEIATVSEREVHLKRRMASVQAEIAELTNTVEQSTRTEEALEVLRARIQPVHDLYSALLDRAEHWAVKLRDRARFEQADSESLRTTIHTAQDAVRAVQTEIETATEGMAEIRVDKGRLEVQVNAAAARIVEELEVPLERALESSTPIEDRDAAQEAAHRLRKQIANIGPVNAVAMEEFSALEKRRDFLGEQMTDLQASRNALDKVVAAIDRKMKDRFLSTFETVDAHFQQVFQVLFPGGVAALRLTDPDDPETTGVEVVAQPRGKKLAKMSLMSGGEKSLTALALLFALYHTRPCPFYILDEVEAALDDTNLRRFVALVDSLRLRTQFIVVTHQRRTMEMADVLYGVSMQADGVSKVVSQKLERSFDTVVEANDPDDDGEEQDERAVV